MAAALVLHALGVTPSDVMHDYMQTNQFLKVQHAELPGVPPDVVAALNGVHEDYLTAAYEAIDQAHGGLEPYLHHSLGMGPRERELLRQRYLQA